MAVVVAVAFTLTEPLALLTLPLAALVGLSRCYLGGLATGVLIVL